MFNSVYAFFRFEFSNMSGGFSNKSKKVRISRPFSNKKLVSSNKCISFSNIMVQSSNKSVRTSNKGPICSNKVIRVNKLARFELRYN